MKWVIGAVLAVVVVGTLAAVALIAGLNAGSRAVENEPGGRSSPGAAAGRVLVYGDGRGGEEVSEDFTVPTGCARQTLTYYGTPQDDEVSWINFRAVDADGNGKGSVGPVDLLESRNGNGLLTLEPGRYALEIEAWEAAWSYELRCR